MLLYFSSVATSELFSLFFYIVVILFDSVDWLSLFVVSLACFLLSPSVGNSLELGDPYNVIPYNTVTFVTVWYDDVFEFWS